jgi:hypothetical protein
MMHSVASVEELAGPLNAANPAETPRQNQSIRKQWQPQIAHGAAKYDFQPHSFTVLKFN